MMVSRCRMPLVLSALAGLGVSGGSVLASESVEQTLANYVSRPDDSTGWRVRQKGRVDTTDFVELIFTSQTWQGILWKHQLFIIKPDDLDPDCTHGFLFVTGGSWRDELEQPPEEASRPREGRVLAALAEQIKAPVAILQQVPRQPIFDGKYEDALISYTFERFMTSGDSDWPLLLPMVKSAVRGMDAVQDYVSRNWRIDLKTFTVSGASKRGWTTWLTGAVDPRATAIAPMVIDVLNFSPQMRHQKAVWGKVSDQIGDYTERGLIEQLDTEEGRTLTALVDPYNYRHLLRQPKLVILGTNDDYWPVDALNRYWDDLEGPKYILYVPNNGHSINDVPRLMGGLNALHRQAAAGEPLPQLRWRFSRAEDKLVLTVSSDEEPVLVNTWTAAAGDRDFRPARWTSTPARRQGDEYVSELPVPESGYAAMFAEAVYGGRTPPLYLSTNLQVAGSTAHDPAGQADAADGR